MSRVSVGLWSCISSPFLVLHTISLSVSAQFVSLSFLLTFVTDRFDIILLSVGAQFDCLSFCLHCEYSVIETNVDQFCAIQSDIIHETGPLIRASDIIMV